jgi:hypothetical protein
MTIRAPSARLVRYAAGVWAGAGLLTILPLLPTATACELCAIYSADSARGTSSAGFLFTVSEQYIAYRTVQLNGDELPPSFLDRYFRDTSITHLVPSYNFSDRLALSVNVPLVRHHFRRLELLPAGTAEEHGTEFGLGDVSVIGRWTAFALNKMDHSLFINVMGGIKTPTGDADRVRAEVEKDRALDAIYGPGHNHFVSGVHEHDLTLGSGSLDGIFGLTLSSRWKRWFLNGQFQYYLRTEGEAGFTFGDEIMVSGGPGGYIWLGDSGTLSLQFNASYDSMARDQINGDKLNSTGWSGWFAGPQLSLTLGEHFSANGGVDIPLALTNNGLQNVPNYRVHAGITFRF